VDETKVPLAGWFICLLIAAACGGLACLAIFERALSLTGKSGIVSYEGSSAVVLGFILLGLSFASVGVPARSSRFRNVIWAGLGVIWTLCVIAYVTFTV
jgi:hypothetical protein